MRGPAEPRGSPLPPTHLASEGKGREVRLAFFFEAVATEADCMHHSGKTML